MVASAKTSAVLELLVTVERDSGFPLHHQLEQQLREAIREGRLGGGATMPSTRALASQLAVARGVVVEAYEQLVAEGYLVSRPGGSTRVAELPNRVPPDQNVGRSEVAGSFIDLRPGRPDVTEFPRGAWARRPPRHQRGAIRPAHVPRWRRCARVARGTEVVPIPVDEDGLQLEPLARSRADAVVVTPAHQFPTGAVRAPERRAALLAWAHERGRLIIEDDYDAEFRYDRGSSAARHGCAVTRHGCAVTGQTCAAAGSAPRWARSATTVGARSPTPVSLASTSSSGGRSHLTDLLGYPRREGDRQLEA